MTRSGQLACQKRESFDEKFIRRFQSAEQWNLLKIACVNSNLEEMCTYACHRVWMDSVSQSDQLLWLNFQQFILQPFTRAKSERLYSVKGNFSIGLSVIVKFGRWVLCNHFRRNLPSWRPLTGWLGERGKLIRVRRSNVWNRIYGCELKLSSWCLTWCTFS